MHLDVFVRRCPKSDVSIFSKPTRIHLNRKNSLVWSYIKAYPASVCNAKYNLGCLLLHEVEESTIQLSGPIVNMKILLDCDWLRAVQFKCYTSAISVTPVQITHPNSGL